MKNSDRDMLYFTRRERTGALVLAVLCCGALFLPTLWNRWLPNRDLNFDRFDSEVALLESADRAAVPEPHSLFFFDPNHASKAELLQLGIPERTANTILNYRRKVGHFEKAEDLKKIYNLDSALYNRIAPYVRLSPIQAEASGKRKDKKESIELFPFNPDTISLAGLKRLGLPEEIAARLIKYREKGGKFFSPADIGKIYGIAEADVQRLLPLVRLPGEEQEEAALPNTAPAPKKAAFSAISVEVDINQAGPEEWQRLYGIGPVLSKRIVRFREKLGGFSAVEQVAETYGLPDSTFVGIRDRLVFSPVFRKLAVNRLDAKGLSRHPYLNWRAAKAIVAYREQHGRFEAPADLEKLHALSSDLIAKMAPYWSFE